MFKENEPGLLGITTEPSVGIGQTAQLVMTSHGSLLWDPPGYADDSAVQAVQAQGPVLAIAASRPHMFGVQVEWSHRLGGAPVFVAGADRRWLGRNDPVINYWSGSLTIAEGLTLHQTGGHFPGSAVVHWAAGAGGSGVLLTGDSVFPNPDRRSIAFMRNYPNHLTLSGAVALRIAAQLGELEFDRMYGKLQQCHRVRSQDNPARFRPTARCVGPGRLRPPDMNPGKPGRPPLAVERMPCHGSYVLRGRPAAPANEPGTKFTPDAAPLDQV